MAMKTPSDDAYHAELARLLREHCVIRYDRARQIANAFVNALDAEVYPVRTIREYSRTRFELVYMRARYAKDLIRRERDELRAALVGVLDAAENDLPLDDALGHARRIVDLTGPQPRQPVASG